MVNPTSPFRSNSKPAQDSDSRLGRSKSSSPNDKFSKIMDKDPDAKHKEKLKVDERDAKPSSSVFDLSGKKKPITPKKSPPNLEQSKNLSDSEESVEEKPNSYESEATEDQYLQENVEEPVVADDQNQSPEENIPKTPIQAPPLSQPKLSNESRLSRPLNRKNESVSSDKKEKKATAGGERSKGAQEKGELTHLHPLQAIAGGARSSSDSSTNMSQGTSKDIQDIADQIVKSLQTVEFRGKTDTIVTLQYPPILKGAQVVLSSFESAPKEFNIAFANLGADAKAMLDQGLSQDSLKLALESKGFVIHLITTSTNEISLPAAAQQFNQRDQEQGKQQQQQQQQENPDEENP